MSRHTVSMIDEGILEQIMIDIETHDRKYPKHSVGCVCHDMHATRLRKLLSGLNRKSRWNLARVLSYVLRDL